MAENNLTIVINGDVAELNAAIQSAEQHLAKFEQTTHNVTQNINKEAGDVSSHIAVIGTAFQTVSNAINSYIIAPLSNAVNGFMEFGDTISKTSQRIGIGIESLQGFKYASEQCGSNFDELTDSVKTFQEQLGAARLGDQGAIDKLGNVGIDFTQFEGLSNEEAFMKLADHIASIGDESQRTRTAVELFGDAGYRLIPFFQEGSQGIHRLMEEGKEVGAVLGKDAVEGAVDLSGAMTRLKTSTANISMQLIGSLAPAISSILEMISTLVSSVSSFYNHNKQTIALVASSIVVFAGLELGLGRIVTALPMLITGFKAVTAAIVANPLMVGGAAIIAGIVTAFAMWNHHLEETEKRLYSLNDSAKAHREEVEKATAADNQMMERLNELKTLSETETLNNSEIAEATKLIETLTGHYGD